jgi:hypothetical protein
MQPNAEIVIEPKGQLVIWFAGSIHMSKYILIKD